MPIPPKKYFGPANNGGVVATTVGLAEKLWNDNINGFSFHNDWNDGTGGGATLAGTLKVEASNDPALVAAASINDPTARLVAEAAAKWHDITGDLTIVDVTSGADSHIIFINNLRVGWVRLTLTVSGGTGTLYTFSGSHGAG